MRRHVNQLHRRHTTLKETSMLEVTEWPTTPHEPEQATEAVSADSTVPAPAGGEVSEPAETAEIHPAEPADGRADLSPVRHHAERTRRAPAYLRDFVGW